MNILNVYELGRVPYKTALSYQEKLLEKRINNEIDDSLLILEHPPTITIGRSGKFDNLLMDESSLAKHGITFERIKRGGDITFHGPGQIVGYPIFDLSKHGKDVHKYLRNLEEVLISTISNYGIQGKRIDKLTGVWIKRSKIASIGIAVRKWVTYHGFALNVNTDLNYFDLIIPCGIKNVRVTSIKEWLDKDKDIDTNNVSGLIKSAFQGIFHFDKIISTRSIDF